MATRAAKAGMDAEAQQRLDAATTALAGRFGVVLPEPPPYVRDPEFRAIQERERLATALERIAAAATASGEVSNERQGRDAEQGRRRRANARGGDGAADGD